MIEYEPLKSGDPLKESTSLEDLAPDQFKLEPLNVRSKKVQKHKRILDIRKVILASQANQLQAQEADHLKTSIRQRVDILGAQIDNYTWDEFLDSLQYGVVFTPNVDHLMTLQQDPEFREVYAQADYRVCDSQILLYASRFLGQPLQAKISGSDLLMAFCDRHRDNENIKLFLLGGAEGVPQKAQCNINARFGREIIVAAHSPSFGFEKDEAECDHIVDLISSSDANVLVVGVGAPKQEKWIVKHRHRLTSIDIFMGLGATIDFEAGCKLRSPQIMSELGLEWLYRLLSEPKRLWRRYLIKDLPFLWLVLKQKLQQVSSHQTRL